MFKADLQPDISAKLDAPSQPSAAHKLLIQYIGSILARSLAAVAVLTATVVHATAIVYESVRIIFGHRSKAAQRVFTVGHGMFRS